MSRTLYVVIQSRDRWWVDLEGKAHGPFSSLEEAADEGLQLAKLAAHQGRDCELLVPDEDGRYRVIWASDDPRRGDGPMNITSAA